MPDNMIEIKKDSMRQCQDGITKVGFTILHTDIPDYLAAAELGKRYYMVLVDADDYDEQIATPTDVIRPIDISINNPLGSHLKNASGWLAKEREEGDKLRIKAVMLSKDEKFQKYTCATCYSISQPASLEEFAAQNIKVWCKIGSRSELATNTEAQEKFKELLNLFETWKLEQTYKDNLTRL